MLLTFLRTWTQEIIVLLILALVIDTALPDSTLRKYVDYGVSVVLLAILLSPILTLLGSTQDVSGMFRVAEASYVQEFEAQEHRFEAASWLAYELIMQDRLEETIKGLPGLRARRLKVGFDKNPTSQDFGQPMALDLWIDADKELPEVKLDESLQRLMYILEHNYGINPAIVRIIID